METFVQRRRQAGLGHGWSGFLFGAGQWTGLIVKDLSSHKVEPLEVKQKAMCGWGGFTRVW